MSAKEVFHQMSRLSRAATQMNAGAVSAETVRSAFTALVKLGGDAVPNFLADVLHGKCGQACAFAAWSHVVARGIAITGEGTPHTVFAPFADYCMYRGSIDIVREILLRGLPEFLPSNMQAENISQLLDLMCETAQTARGRMTGSPSLGLVGTAAVSYRDCPHASDALALAWETDPKHPGFHVFSQEPSEQGAFVRAFLMERHIAGTQPACTPSVAKSHARARGSL